MATLFEWQNLMWDGWCKAVHIVSMIESVKHTQLRCEECTYTQLALSSWIQSAQPRTFSAAQLSSFINRIRSKQHNQVHSSIVYVQCSAIEYMPVHAHTGVQSRAFVIFDWLRCWHGIWPDGFCGVRPKAAGMRPVACGPHGLPPAPMPRSRSIPGSDAWHRSPDVIHGFAEYALLSHIYLPVFLSLCSLDNHFCTIVNSISLFVLDWSQHPWTN